MAETDIKKIIEKLDFGDKNSVVDSLMNAMTDEQKKMTQNVLNDKSAIEKLLKTPEAEMIFNILKRKGSE